MIERHFTIELSKYVDTEEFGRGTLLFPRRGEIQLPPHFVFICPETGNVWGKIRWGLPSKWHNNWHPVACKPYSLDLERYLLLRSKAADIKGDSDFWKVTFMMLCEKLGDESLSFEMYEPSYYRLSNLDEMEIEVEEITKEEAIALGFFAAVWEYNERIWSMSFHGRSGDVFEAYMPNEDRFVSYEMSDLACFNGRADKVRFFRLEEDNE